MKALPLLLAAVMLHTLTALAAETDLVLIKGGTYTMGSASDIAWRGEDEGQHQVMVNDFMLGKYEVTQRLYQQVTGENPSLNKGDDLPVENLSWLEAVAFCNALSLREKLTPFYSIKEDQISCNEQADGYRLPTEAEWEYACRSGSTDNYSVGESISAEEANYCGHYPYNIEPHYFNPEALKVQPGIYRDHTVAVTEFSPNALGLYNLHGNVCEWVYDSYSEDYQAATRGSDTVLKVYRGGGFNDFAKHLRSAYRGVLPYYLRRMSIGLRLARNAAASASAQSYPATRLQPPSARPAKGLVVFFSWSGNTRRLAEIIAQKTSSDLLELKPVTPYSQNYSEVLVQAWQDQLKRAEPELANLPSGLAGYDTIYLGYPLWWASIPRPIVSFLRHYDLKGRKIMVFSSGGGGHLQQSFSDLLKLSAATDYGPPFEVSYSGGKQVEKRVEQWLKNSGIGE